MYGDASWLDTAGRLIIVFFFLAASRYNAGPAKARVANAMFHRFWRVTDPARRHTLRLLLLNGIAILGGLLLLLQNVR
jgi:hypothetical protein